MRLSVFRIPIRGLAAAILASFLSLHLVAAEEKGTSISSACAEASADTPESPWERETLTGSWGGTRTRLAEKGLEFETIYIGEVLANVQGGVRRGELYQGLLRSDVNLDIEKAGGWKGGAFHVSGLWIEGTEPNSHNDIAGMTGTAFLEPSNISAYDTARLYELWMEQGFFDGRLSFRGGQVALDEEFLCSEYGCLFLSGTCGWPAFMSATIPSGGTAYPVAGLGGRVKWTPIEQLDLLAAAVEGDVCDQDGINRNGTDFHWGDGEGVLAIVEVAYRLNHEKESRGLPGTYKLGGWYHSARFDHLSLDSDGLSLEDDGTLSGLASRGVPRNCHGNGGVFFNIDQMLFREKKGLDEGLGLYARVAPWMGDDCNSMDFYAAGGLAYKGAIPTRENDVCGVAINYCRVSDSLRRAQRDANTIVALGGTPNHLAEGPVPDYEMSLEATYRVALAPWWSLQPDFQYIFHPGGSKALEDAVVVGLRTTVSF